MTELDDVLRGSFARIAEPGDPAGVVADIQSRLDSGDTGTPSDSSGFGGGIRQWLPWIGVVAVAGLIGATIGVTGVVGRPIAQVATIGYSALLDDRVDVLACPGGDAVGTLVQGERVLAIARSDDGAYLAVRDPYDSSATLWLPTRALVVDEGELDVESLPADGCDQPVVTVATPEPTPTPTQTQEPEPQPGPAPKPQPARDATAPTLSQAAASPSTITMQGYSQYCGTDVSTVSVLAADNVGVASVTATWKNGGTAALTPSGGTWSFAFSGTSTGAPNPYSIAIVARDAAGNASAPAVTSVTVTYCLI